MTEVRFVNWWIGDYLADTPHLTRAQHGSYLMLLFHYYLHGALPGNDSELARIALMSRRQWYRERRVLLKFFRIIHRRRAPPIITHKRCDAELKRILNSRQIRPQNQREGRFGTPLSQKNSTKSTTRAHNNQYKNTTSTSRAVRDRAAEKKSGNGAALADQQAELPLPQAKHKQPIPVSDELKYLVSRPPRGARKGGRA